MVAAQKRYSSLFKTIARKAGKLTHSLTGKCPVLTGISIYSNDGRYIAENDRRYDRVNNPSYHSAGKLTDTGYYILDTIPWLIKYSGEILKEAEVTAHL